MNALDIVIRSEFEFSFETINSIEAKMLSKGFLTLVKSPENTIFLKTNSKDAKEESISINGEVCVFSVKVPFDDTKTQEYFGLLCDLMQMVCDEDCSLSISLDLVELFKGEGVSAKDILLGYNSFDMSSEGMRDVTGVGYRFLVKHSKGFDEFNIEPYLEDMDYLFFKSQFNVNDIKLQEVPEYFQSTYNKHRMRTVDLLKI